MEPKQLDQLWTFSIECTLPDFRRIFGTQGAYLWDQYMSFYKGDLLAFWGVLSRSYRTALLEAVVNWGQS